MRVNNVAILLLALFSLNVHAKVRDLTLSSEDMGKIYLKMGKSTLLRFPNKPKKVVIGNQNYFNVEFIDNDVSIQPLGVATTNLFVYEEYQSYGFILSVIGHDSYDDLVNVKRKMFSYIGGQEPKEKKENKVKEVANNQVAIQRQLDDLLFIEVQKIFYSPPMGIYVMDINFKNKSKKILKSKDLAIVLSRNGKPLEKQNLIFRQDWVNVEIILNSRVFFKSPQESFTLTIKYKNKEWKQIIDGKFLK